MKKVFLWGEMLVSSLSQKRCQNLATDRFPPLFSIAGKIATNHRHSMETHPWQRVQSSQKKLPGRPFHFYHTLLPQIFKIIYLSKAFDEMWLHTFLANFLLKELLPSLVIIYETSSLTVVYIMSLIGSQHPFSKTLSFSKDLFSLSLFDVYTGDVISRYLYQPHFSFSWVPLCHIESVCLKVTLKKWDLDGSTCGYRREAVAYLSRRNIEMLPLAAFIYWTVHEKITECLYQNSVRDRAMPHCHKCPLHPNPHSKAELNGVERYVGIYKKIHLRFVYVKMFHVCFRVRMNERVWVGVPFSCYSPNLVV